MPRTIKSGLIQMSLPKTEGEGTIDEIKEAMVQKHLPLIEEALAPYNVRPHWGKLFTIAPATLQSRYPGLDEFKGLMKRFDPTGKFRNEFIDRNLFSA